MSDLAKVVIVGRMNVGKSTLFNRLSTRVKSITHDYAGVTRDFLKDTVCWKDACFSLLDTGGVNLRATDDEILAKVQQQVLAMIEGADLVVFVVDGSAGLMPEDQAIARMLRKKGRQVLLAINKADRKDAQEHIFEFARLGFEHVLISAEHGTGIEEMLDAIMSKPGMMRVASTEKKSREFYKVALLGKPNVGKSSLLNALVEQERSLVANVPGTTREAISEKVSFYQADIQLTDTPGVRRQKMVRGEELESLMVKSALQAARDADIVLLLIDASQAAISDQELKLAFYVLEQNKALIIVFNKADLMTEAIKTELASQQERYSFLFDRAAQLTISCINGKNVGKVLPLIHQVWQRYSQTFPARELETLCKEALIKKPLYHKTMLLVLHRVVQTSTAPISLLFKVNVAEWFGPSQLAFFEHQIRAAYDLRGVPIKFVVQKKG